MRQCRGVEHACQTVCVSFPTCLPPITLLLRLVRAYTSGTVTWSSLLYEWKFSVISHYHTGTHSVNTANDQTIVANSAGSGSDVLEIDHISTKCRGFTSNYDEEP